MWVFLFLMFSTCKCSRTFYSPDMCKTRNVTDCSFQIKPFQEKSCTIYRTAVCLAFDFKNWTSVTTTEAVSETNAPFSVSVLPYGVEVFKEHKRSPVLSALNLKISTIEKGINGFIIYLLEESQKKNICRIFDFRNHSLNGSMPVTVFYDCFSNLVEKNIQNVVLMFRALPVNIELRYFLFIPPVPESLVLSSCDWQPLVLIFHGSLIHHVVHVKFSQAPEYLNISLYNVRVVLNSSNEEIQSALVSGSNKSSLLAVKFSDIDMGYYHVTVSATNGRKVLCNKSETSAFFVGSGIGKKYDFVFVIAVLTVIIICVILFLYWLFRFDMPSLKPHILMLYSFDCPEHENLIITLVEYLETYCNLIVNTIYGINGNPNTWIEERYAESDIIMYVISEGLFHVIEHKNNPPLKEGHHWQNQLSVAQAYISAEAMNSLSNCEALAERKKFCKIVFPYCDLKFVPKVLHRKGKLYHIPQEMNKLLCFLYGCNPKIPCTKIFPVLPGSVVDSSNKGKELLKKIDIMKCVVKNGCHIHYIEAEHDEKDVSPDSFSGLNRDISCIVQNESSEDLKNEAETSGIASSSQVGECRNPNTWNYKSNSVESDYIRSLVRMELYSPP